MRARKAYREEDMTQDQYDAFMQYQIYWDNKYYRLNFVTLPALDMYKSIYLHIRVPYAFIVPSAQSWSKNSWGV